jgi:putative FmdB family regulatory protein
MPIYAYRCENCGFAKDVLQKISDPLLTVCPNCGQDTFRKQVTAAGFQLKGSGWYVTDFRDKPGDKSATSTPPASPKTDSAPAAAAPAADAPAASPSPAPAPAPAPKSDKPSSSS